MATHRLDCWPLTVMVWARWTISRIRIRFKWESTGLHTCRPAVVFGEYARRSKHSLPLWLLFVCRWNDSTLECFELSLECSCQQTRRSFDDTRTAHAMCTSGLRRVCETKSFKALATALAAHRLPLEWPHVFECFELSTITLMGLVPPCLRYSVLDSSRRPPLRRPFEENSIRVHGYSIQRA